MIGSGGFISASQAVPSGALVKDHLQFPGGRDGMTDITEENA